MRAARLLLGLAAACGQPEAAPPVDDGTATVRAHFEHVLAALPPPDAPERRCAEADVAPRAQGGAAVAIQVHADRLRELVGQKAERTAAERDADELRRLHSNTTLEDSTLTDAYGAREIPQLVRQRPWLVVTRPLRRDAASSAGAPTVGERRGFFGGRAEIFISVHDPVTGAALCWTIARARSSAAVLYAKEADADDNVRRDLESNAIESVRVALAQIAPLTLREQPWL